MFFEKFARKKTVRDTLDGWEVEKCQKLCDVFYDFPNFLRRNFLHFIE